MKHRLTVLLASACFSLSLLFNINTIIPIITVSAADVTLTPAQTFALYGDTIHVQGYDSNNDASWYEFNFYSSCTVNAQSLHPNTYFNEVGYQGLLYRSTTNFNNSITSVQANNNQCTAYIPFQVAIGNSIHFVSSFGFSRSTARTANNLNAHNGESWKDWEIYHSYLHWEPYDEDFYIGYVASGAYLYANTIGTVADDTNESRLNICTIQVQKSSMDDLDINNGLFLRFVNHMQKPQFSDTLDDGTLTNAYTWLYVMCPILSEGYINLNDSSSDDSGGSDYPDYSTELQTIINELDVLIANSQDRYIQLGLIHSDLQSSNSKLDEVNSNLNKIDSHIQQIRGADLSSLYYPSNGDNSRYQSAEHQLQSEMQAAMGDHAYLDSVRNFAGQSLPDLQNRNQLDSSFDNLWYYEDSDGFKWQNMMLFSMPVVTLMIGIISYIIFGKKG